MAIYYAYGDALVGLDELRVMSGQGKLQQFHRDLLKGSKGGKLDFISGRATAQNILRSQTTPPAKTIDFVPIGLGKPLTVQIRHIYTGDKAEGFWGSKDMLVTSAMRSISTYDAAPRAVNF